VSEVVYCRKFNDGIFNVFNDKPTTPLIHVHQVHGNLVVPYENHDLNEVQADGIICDKTQLKGKSIAIKTADCLPILYLSDEKVAMVHAGWRGVHSKIHIADIIIQMQPHTILIGPSIQQESFEVTGEFKENFPNSPFFKTNQRDQLLFSLQDQVKQDLTHIISSATIIDESICTFLDTHYNSYRRDKTSTRNWNTYTLL
jgi:YfiH family protein